MKTDREIAEAVIKIYAPNFEIHPQAIRKAVFMLTQLLDEERQAAKDVVGKCEKAIRSTFITNDEVYAALTEIVKWKETTK